MATYLFIRSMEPVVVEENYNLVRQRLNEVITQTNRDGSPDESNRPMHKVSFHTIEGGRIAIVPEHIIGVGSDEHSDTEEE